MKRILILAVIMLTITTAYAQKRTDYKFRFESAVDMNTKLLAVCDFEFGIFDILGESPAVSIANYKNSQLSVDNLVTTIAYNPKEGMIYFGNMKGDALFCITLLTNDDGTQSCALLVYEIKNEKTTIQYGLTNESGSTNDKQCNEAYKVLLENVKTNNFNNFTVNIM